MNLLVCKLLLQPLCLIFDVFVNFAHLAVLWHEMVSFIKWYCFEVALVSHAVFNTAVTGVQLITHTRMLDLVLVQWVVDICCSFYRVLVGQEIVSMRGWWELAVNKHLLWANLNRKSSEFHLIMIFLSTTSYYDFRVQRIHVHLVHDFNLLRSLDLGCGGNETNFKIVSKLLRLAISIFKVTDIWSFWLVVDLVLIFVSERDFILILLNQ